MKLKTRIIVLLLPLTILVTALPSIFFGLIEYRDTLQTLDEEGLKIVKVIAIGSQEALMSNNLEVMREYTNSLNREPEILYVSIHNWNNKIVSHTESSYNGKIPDDELSLKAYRTEGPLIQKNSYEGIKCSDYSYPLIMEGRRWGHIRLGLSYERVNQHLSIIVTRAILMTLLIMILMTIMAVIISGIVVNPIEELSQRAASLDSSLFSNLDESLFKKEIQTGSLELRQLAGTFSNMALNLRKSLSRLKESEKNLSITLNSIGDAVITTDKEGKVTRMNPVAERLTGWRLEEVKGRALESFFNIVDGLTREKRENPVATVLESRRITWLMDNTLLISRDGREYQIADSAAPIIEEKGSSSGVVLVFRDETEKVKSEQQLIQAQKMEAVGTLAGGLAHDFNNMLGGILGPISLIEQKMTMPEGLNDEDLKDFISMIKMSGQRASELVKRLLTISHRHRISMSPVDLNTLLRHVVKIAANTFDRSIEIIPHYSEKPAMTMADALQIEQALLNLSINSCHAMTTMRGEESRWGGTLELSLSTIYADSLFLKRHPYITKGDYWIIGVKDRGVGIKREDLPNIFTPFFTTKKRGKGTGLGLSMAYSIVKQHKGAITVNSERGVGTTFNIYLPLLKREADPESETARESQISRGKGLILIIDDELVLREMARMMLEECGYQTLVAQDGQEGLKLFKERHDKIDGVLLDLVMPRMSGKETFKRMKMIDPSVKVLLSSGYKEDNRINSVLNMGARGFIQKPYDLETLSRAVKTNLFS